MNERQLTAKQWFWAILVFGAVSRFFLLGHFTAEFTDGIYYVDYFKRGLFNDPNLYVFPGFPALLEPARWLGWDPILWGRSVAAVFGVALAWPVWKIARRLVSVEVAGFACLTLLFSPEPWFWSLRVMADTTFVFFFWMALERLIAQALKPRSAGASTAASLWGAAAAFVRPEGFLLLPVILREGWRARKVQGRSVFWATVLAWVPASLFLFGRMRLLASAYEEGLRMGGGPFGLLIPCINVLEHLYVYLTQTPYLVTPLVFCFSLGGLWVLLHRPSLSIRRAMGPVLIVLGLLFASRLVPTLYQDRHQLPFIPFWILLAAIGFQKTVDAWRLRWKGERFLLLKNGTVLAVLAFEVVFSIACFSFQRESFADLRHGAEFLRQLPPEARIFTDEFPKTYYWAKRDLTPWQPNMRLPEGAYLVLHSFYTKRDRLLVSRLMENYQARVVFYEESAVTPLLSDLMEEAAYQNRTALVGMRFETQDFRTWVIRLGKTSP